MQTRTTLGAALAVLLSAACGPPPAFAGKPAPPNPYHGAQTREEVFEFAEKPAVRKQGGGWVISFATKAACDATVSIVDADGKIVRHLASGVLGKNAPYPFEQGSLSQSIEWDGLDDGFRSAPAGCRVRVGLGLSARFERNLLWEPGDLPASPSNQRPEDRGKLLTATGTEGKLYVLAMDARSGFQGRVFDKDRKYLRTFWPPAAADVAKLADFDYEFATTVWGDKALVCGWFGPTHYPGDARKKPIEELGRVMFGLVGIAKYEAGPRPEQVPPPQGPEVLRQVFGVKFVRMAVDRRREDLYVGHPDMGLLRLDGRTGALDETWFPGGELDRVTECHVGPDGLLYIRIGPHGYGLFIARLDHDGEPVDFGGDAITMPLDGKWPDTGEQIYGGRAQPEALWEKDFRVLWVGLRQHSNTHERGLYVSPDGRIVAAVQAMERDWGVRHGVPDDAPQKDGRLKGSYVPVWDRDGKLLTADAVGNMQNGHGVAMDREGNIYAAMGGRVPQGQENYWGLVDRPLRGHFDHGCLVKFSGARPFPRGRAHYGSEVPEGVAVLKGYRGTVQAIEGAEWIFGGLMCQRPDICTCHNLRYDVDYFARHWLPANHLYSVVVIDANANLIARLGRYGNVDDTAKDIQTGGDGLRFAWPRALAVSDGALYVVDQGNRRILRAAIGYYTEAEVALP